MILGSALVGLAGCALPRQPAVPNALRAEATIPGIPGARFFSETPDAGLTRWILETQRQRGFADEANILAISGGGEDGAFGAGLITAWTRRGDRPSFDVVTGVSTGALTAPLAFLGPSRDSQLEQVYTQLTPTEIFAWRPYSATLFDDGLWNSAPLLRTIRQIVDQGMLDEIAAAYDRGRLLLIGTTDLDARRSVVWNMGAIARSGAPGALELARRVLLASASIPGAFPPVMMDVEAGGQRWQEMHVDGGAVSQAFLFPARVAAEARSAGARQPRSRIWLIHNGRAEPAGGEVPRLTLPIAGAAIATMTAASASGDVRRIWLRAERAGFDFNLAEIGDEFTTPYEGLFDPAYMRPLFAYGARRMAEGHAWMKAPVGEQARAAAGVRRG
jgi:predicted acylesterase/phospholipase RssA